MGPQVRKRAKEKRTKTKRRDEKKGGKGKKKNIVMKIMIKKDMESKTRI